MLAATMTEPPSDADVLILGGGSAGCVLAARLSARAALRVVLVEAGDDPPPERLPVDIRNPYPGRAYFNRAYTWPDLEATLGAAHLNAPQSRPRTRYEQARIMGGGSSINGLGGNRGAPSDYDEWAARGLPEWGWTDVEPYFRKLERDLDEAGPEHGHDGPLPVRRVPEARWSPFTRAVTGALEARGFARRRDQNGAWEDGVMPTTLVLDENWTRVSTATGYLTPAVRARPNLTILAHARAERIEFEGRRATGASVIVAGARRRIAARLVVVSCGAIHSPALLLRSGIGPGAAARELGIDVVADLPGVGRNLMEHPGSNVSCLLRPSARMPAKDAHHIAAILRFSSGLPGCPAGDMHAAIIARSAWHAIGRRIGTIFVWVNKSYSTGELRLVSPDPAVPPEVDFRLLSDLRDQARLAAGIRLAAATLADPALDPVRRIVFPTYLSARIRKVARPGWRNALALAAVGAAVDAGGEFGDRLLQRLASRDVDLTALLADDAALGAYLQTATTGCWHASGTCRMGPAGDRLAVTDAGARVHGIDGLAVCDASLMPTIPRANLNFPVVMMAEKIADRMLAAS